MHAQARSESRTDPRVMRSTRALGAALVELMLEERFEDITVQHILDRAGVGRSTFYAHFRNKGDVLHSSYERMFGWLEHELDAALPRRPRIAPVAEFLEHIGEAGPMMDALRSSGQLEEMSDLAVGFFARMIERRIAPMPGTTPPVPPGLVARMLAGALMEMVWWWDRHRATSPAAQMDATFHALASTLLRHASYEPVSASA